MKKNSTMILGLALATALSLGMTGCGSDDNNDKAQEVVDALTGGGSGDSSTTGGGAVNNVGDLSKYSYIIIYKNVSGAVADQMKTSYESYSDFHFETVSSAVSCTDFGFTSAQADTYDYGSGVVTTYSTPDYSKYCTETDFSNTGYASGSENVVLYYNY